MVSPFPGMDPFLEGYLWPDVHNRLASVIAEVIAVAIAPKYVARIELYTFEDSNPEGDVGIMYPDVEILRRKNIAKEPMPTYARESAVLSAATISIPDTMPIEVRIPVVEIRDRQSNQLITAIEILSPVNKRDPGLIPYREKRKHLHEAGVHLLEIDLLRRGQRPFNHPYLPKNHYIITLVRAETNRTDVWGFDIKDPLPTVPVPLKAPDPDVPLNMGEVLNIIYERSLYHLSINYDDIPPPPAFSEEDQAWMKELLKKENIS